jgi:dehydrogenase/reductase SDR family protein 12
VLCCFTCHPQALASRGATLFMLCRNQQRGQEAVQAVREQTGNKDVQLAVRRPYSL